MYDKILKKKMKWLEECIDWFG